MDVKKVLYISQEIEPYLPTSPLADFGRRLPQAILDKGVEVRTFMPKYGAINERRNQLHEVIRLSGLNIDINDTDYPLIIKVATLQPSRMQVYFIDSEDFFTRTTDNKLETTTDASCNDERAIFFVRGTLETVKKLRWTPDVIHCTGWISALIPLYLKKMFSEDPAFRSAKVVYSLFEDSFDGTLDSEMVAKLIHQGFTAEDLKGLSENDEGVDYIKLSKLAIDHADAICQASEKVNPELVEYAKASGKPFLPYPGENLAAYEDFYKSL